MPTNQPLVYILVLHWRGIEHTRTCLESVSRLQYLNQKILLVDNGSDALDGDQLKSEFEQIELLRLVENRGFSGGCNAGIAHCLSKGADYVWVLNNDTVVRHDSLSLLVQAAEQNAKAAALSAAVLDSVPVAGQSPVSSLQKTSVRAAIPSGEPEKIIPGRGVLDFGRAKSLLKQTSGELPVACEWLAASNLLLRSSAIKEMSGGKGAFDDRYFLYFEDTELCHRLTLQGWQCIFVPAAKISHVGGASTDDKLQHWRSYYYTRNRLLFFSTYATFPLKTLTMLAIYAHLLRHRLSLPGKGERGRRQLAAEMLGLKDFRRGRFGKCIELD